MDRDVAAERGGKRDPVGGALLRRGGSGKTLRGRESWHPLPAKTKLVGFNCKVRVHLPPGTSEQLNKRNSDVINGLSASSDTLDIHRLPFLHAFE